MTIEVNMIQYNLQKMLHTQ